MTGQLLTPEQINFLKAMSKKSASDILKRRARILMLYNSGRSTSDISVETGLSQSTLRYWRGKFLEKGMEIFTAERAPRSSAISEPQSGQVIKIRRPPRLKSKSARPLSANLPMPRVTKKAGLKPGDPMSEAGRKILLFQFAHMLDHEDGTLLGVDIEELHDMRVASRRMRAAFDIFRPFFKPKDVRRYLKGLRATGRALGRVRDLDVFMEKAQLYLETLPPTERPGLDPLLLAWNQERSAAREKLVTYLGSTAYQQFKHEFNLFVTTPASDEAVATKKNSKPGLVMHITPVLIYQHLAEVRSYDSVVTNAAIEQLHALRIAFKKLRYAVEFFSEVLGPQAREVVEEIKTLQDHLGNLNDADVACRILREFIESWEQRQANQLLQDRQNPEPVVAYLANKHAELHQLMVSFPAAWARFNRPELMTKLALAISIL
jgi:CHAD domain-containing protein